MHARPVVGSAHLHIRHFSLERRVQTNVMPWCSLAVRFASLHSQKEGCVFKRLPSGTRFKSLLLQGRQHTAVM